MYICTYVPLLCRLSLIFHPYLWASDFKNRIDGVLVSVLASSVVDRGFEPQSGQTKDYKMGICCFTA